ncbi:MAG: DUF2909 domain-containing protein [Cellvibrionaceae bacterium]
MGLKILVVALFIGVVISLTSSLIFLLKDIESPTKRGLYALGIRITLAALLLVTIFYGLYTGKLGSGAPWDTKLTKEQIEQQIKQNQ